MTHLAMDVTGSVCAAARMDDSRTITYKTALAKVSTACEFQASTADHKPALGQLGTDIALSGGGVPIVTEGGLAGAIGTSGATEDEDFECAEVALAAALRLS